MDRKESTYQTHSSRLNLLIRGYLRSITGIPWATVVVRLAIIAVVLCLACSQDPGPNTLCVESFSPSGETPRTTNFTIEFSEDIVSDSQVNTRIKDRVIEFEPPIAGTYRWIARNKIRFYPEVLLNPSTEYIASVFSPFLSVHGFSLTGDTEFEFHTPRFRVNDASLVFQFTPGSDGITKLVATIEFNYDVDPHLAADRISIRHSDGQIVPYRMITNKLGSLISLEAEDVERMEEDREVILVASSGLTCVDGGTGLSEDYVIPAILPAKGNLVISSVMPVFESDQTPFIRIKLNIPVRAEDASDHISIDPAVDHRVISHHNYLELRGDFRVSETYVVTIDEDLLAVDGSTLARSFSSAVSFLKEDIRPQIDFVGHGFYLTKGGNLNVGLSTINVDSVSIEIDKVFSNNLVYLLNSESLKPGGPYARSYANLRTLGRHVQSFDLQIDRIRNREMVVPISIEEYLTADEAKGIYRVTARLKERRWQASHTWVVATDLGIVAKRAGDDIYVWVNSLSTLEPIRGASLTLLSRNNQELMTARTDGDGFAVFESLERFADDLVPYLIVASSRDDLSFVDLSRRQIRTSSFDTDGSPPHESGYRAFIYDERGVYRPGETAHVVAVIRDADASVSEPFPVRLRVKDPDLRILTEPRGMLDEQGSVGFDVTIPDYVKTGKYTAELLIGDKEEIGYATFMVEEFVPDRMKVSIGTDLERYRVGDTAIISVAGMTLFGPPASQRRVSVEVEIEAYPFAPLGWDAFIFSDRDKSFSKKAFTLGDQLLNNAGTIEYAFEIPDDFDPPASLRGVIAATVLEPGGRGVTAYAGMTIHPHDAYVGLRRTEQGYATPGVDVEHRLIVVDTEGEPVAGHPAEVSLYRIYWQSVLKQENSGGPYRYVSEKVQDLVERFTIESQEQEVAFSVVPKDYGRYSVVVRDTESGASASIGFYASGWGYCPWAMDRPDRIEIDLDREVYEPGGKAEIQVRTPFPGKLLLTVESNGVLDHRIMRMDQNTASITIPVRESYKPNVYVSGHLVRSTESLDRDTPVRAFGVVPLMVSTEANQLHIKLEAPDEIRPNSTLPVSFRVSGTDRLVPHLTVAAVDEGICQLTDFRVPDIHQFFFGKKRLEVISFDTYGEILPEIESSLSSTSGGADSEIEATRKRHLAPVSVKRVKPVALWSGIVSTDSRGYGQVNFDIPQFNGTIRLMVVGFAGDKLGSTERGVLVRDPVVLTPTFPRFIGSDDSLTIPVSVFNGTGEDGTFDVELQVEGPVNTVGDNLQSVIVSQGKEKTVFFDLKADNAVGEVNFRIVAEGCGEISEVTVDIPLRPPVPFVTRSGAGSVEDGDPASFSFPEGFIDGTAEFTLCLTSMPAVKFARSLQYLLKYPHGCVEQTTSRLFPLLYFDDLARLAEPELFDRNSADYYLEEGIAKLETMQLQLGAFSFWPNGDYTSNWGSIYASHFLVEARKAGYTVSPRVYNRMIDALERAARQYGGEDSISYQCVVYACYVLALAGKPNRRTMHFIKDNVLNRLCEYSQYQLAGTFALTGDMNNARSLLPRVPVVDSDEGERDSGGNLNSSVRALAIILDVLGEIDVRHPMIPGLVKSLTDAASEHGRWYTTQENAFAYLALGKLMRKQSDAEFAGVVKIGGRHLWDFDTKGGTMKSKAWAGKQAAIQVTGPGTCYYYWRADGLPSALDIDEYDHDLIARRRYLDEKGSAIDYTDFRQGDLIIAEITIEAPNRDIYNVAIVDLLPTGFEIENPRLQSRKGLSWIDNDTYQPSYMDIRDDRLIFYGNFSRGKKHTFHYALRVVTRGLFILPPIRAEAMYAPAVSSVSSSGRIIVRSP